MRGVIILSIVAFVAANPLAEDVIGETKVHLDATNCSRFECNIGNLIADSVRYSFQVEHHEGRPAVGSIILVPGSRVRTSIDKDTELTETLLKEVLPDNEDLIIKPLKGSVVREALEHSVHHYNQKDGSNEFLQIGNAEVEFDFENDHGSRVTSLKVLCADCTAYEDVKDDAIYDVVMTDYLANGRSGFSMLGSNENIEKLTNNDYAATKDYISRNTPIATGLDDRIRIHNFDKAPASHGTAATASIFAVIITVIVRIL